MQNPLLDLIDSVFKEFETSAVLQTGPVPSAMNIQTTSEIDEDSDWYDVPLEDGGERESQIIDEVQKPLVAAEADHISESESGCVLCQNSNLVADIRFKSAHVKIQATVLGDIEMPANSLLIVTRNAMITGTIHASTIRISGVVLGSVHADKVEITETGSVQGDVFYVSAIGIAQGAEVCGRIQKNIH